MAKKKAFIDILGDQLGQLPEAVRTVMALDPRCVLTLPSQFLDASDRSWNVFQYFQNDIDLRATWESIKGNNERFLVIATGNLSDTVSPFHIDLSYVPDLVEEADKIIDCSPQGLLSELFEDPLPPNVFEEPLLSIWAQDLGGFLANLKKYQKISGKKAVLNRYDAMWVCLCSSSASLKLESIADLSQEPMSRLFFYLRAVAENKLTDEELSILKDFILGLSPEETIQVWCNLERYELLRFLYLGLAVIRYAVPKGVGELQRLGLLEFDTDQLGDSFGELLDSLRKDLQFVRLITSETEKSRSVAVDTEKLVGRFRFGSHIDALEAFEDEPCPAIIYCFGKALIKLLLASTEGRKALGSWHSEEKLHRDSYPRTPFTHKARRLRNLIRDLSFLEYTLNKAPPPPNNLLDLINTYSSSNLHLLELTIAQAYEIVRLLPQSTDSSDHS